MDPNSLISLLQTLAGDDKTTCGGCGKFVDECETPDECWKSCMEAMEEACEE